MDKYKGSFVQYSFSRVSKPDDRVEIHQNKIVPKREDINNRREQLENEWQQEYFIIYNSYVLDEKDSED